MKETKLVFWVFVTKPTPDNKNYTDSHFIWKDYLGMRIELQISTMPISQ